MKPYDLMRVALIVQEMREDSEQWHEANEEQRRDLEARNRDLAHKLVSKYGIPALYNPDGGTWRIGKLDGPMLYDIY